jgi:hypothetical protein
MTSAIAKELPPYRLDIGARSPELTIAQSAVRSWPSAYSCAGTPHETRRQDGAVSAHLFMNIFPADRAGVH